ncbi:MAG: 50S ribosomal protein L19e [Nanoarchaeota archaeon]
MNLSKKKILAAHALKVGKKRIAFATSRLADIKEAITKQDIKDLHKDGAIFIKEIKGRKKRDKKAPKRSPGNVRKKVNKRKQEYVIMTRKLRKHVAEIKKQGILSVGEIKDMRKKIRNKAFRSKAHMKEYVGGLKKR